ASPRLGESPRGPRKGQPLRGALPHPQLDMRLAQCRGQLVDLGLQLLLTTRGTGLTALGNPGPAALEELGLPPRHRLLRDLVPPSGLGDRHLPAQHAQHDPDLVLHREHRGTAHRHTSCSGTYIPPEPQSLTRDTCRPPRTPPTPRTSTPRSAPIIASNGFAEMARVSWSRCTTVRQ